MDSAQDIMTKLEKLDSQHAGLFREFKIMRDERNKAIAEVKATNTKLFWWMKLCSFVSALFLGAASTLAYIAWTHCR